MNKDIIMECPICYDILTLDILKCFHSVCKPCISKLQKRICPICRACIDDENNNINNVDFSFIRPRARRRRMRERVREVEEIINQIFRISLNNPIENFDNEIIEDQREEMVNISFTRKQSCKKSRNRLKNKK